MNGWLGREDSNLEMANWKSDALACPRVSAEPLFVELHKALETFEFREPYRIGGVQSFGEKRATRRIISGLCRPGVRSSNEKSPLLLGLIANEFTRRIHGFGQAGGAKGIRTAGTICPCLNEPDVSVPFTDYPKRALQFPNRIVHCFQLVRATRDRPLGWIPAALAGNAG